MSTTKGGILPKWAPRVPPATIRRLYERDALGIVDEELIDEVAFALKARCESILTVTATFRGVVLCPACEFSIQRTPGENEVLHCERCGWETPWERYVSAYRRKQLFGGAGEPVFREYVDRFARADTPRKRMLLVDWLLHQCHQSLQQRAKGLFGRPIAVNLIDARIREVIAFLDGLAYGEASPPELHSARETWRQRVMTAYEGERRFDG